MKKSFQATTLDFLHKVYEKPQQFSIINLFIHFNLMN